jgi:hypothetical protein
VALALTFDRGLATTVAARPEDDDALQRKLWLAIARHLIAAAAAAPDADAVRARARPALHPPALFPYLELGSVHAVRQRCG